MTGSNSHPEPLPPVKDIEVNLCTSKSCGSTNTSFTSPIITGSTFACVVPVLIVISGGVTTSKPLPPFRTSNFFRGP